MMAEAEKYSKAQRFSWLHRSVLLCFPVTCSKKKLVKVDQENRTVHSFAIAFYRFKQVMS